MLRLGATQVEALLLHVLVTDSAPVIRWRTVGGKSLARVLVLSGLISSTTDLRCQHAVPAPARAANARPFLHQEATRVVGVAHQDQQHTATGEAGTGGVDRRTGFHCTMYSYVTEWGGFSCTHGAALDVGIRKVH